MTQHFVQHAGISLSYYVAGTGEQSMVMFHGFGQDGLTFSELASHLAADYTLYSFDLPFHGSSVCKESGKPIQKGEWKELMALFFEHHRITSFRIVAYSLGCKFALTTFELFPSQINSLALIAPDGIQDDRWYTLATSTAIMRSVFKILVVRPGLFFGITRLLRKVGIIDPATQRFAESQMNTPEKRKRVYLSWTAFRDLKIDAAHVISILHVHSLEVILFVGKNDPVIQLKRLETFTAKLPSARIEVLDKGHYTVLTAAMKMLR